MNQQIKKQLETEIKNYISYIDRKYSLSQASPSIINHIKEFICREGKRIRPLLFICTYKGLSKKNPKNLFRTAIGLELLHDFLLIHDDIVDKANLRRGKPTMHILLTKELPPRKKLTIRGEDLALIIGDIIYAIAIEAFLSIGCKPLLKEKALIKFIEATCYTGYGEYIELILSTKPIKDVTKDEIYKIYDYKTAYYTFIAPLVTAAILAGLSDKKINQLQKAGKNIGRAFQIKDDILGIFGTEKDTGKPSLNDLQESKKTILIWYAYQHSSIRDRLVIQKIMNKHSPCYADLHQIQQIIKTSGSLNFAKKEINRLYKQAKQLLTNLPIIKKYKETILNYCEKILIG